jgi:hypothetical protein
LRNGVWITSSWGAWLASCTLLAPLHLWAVCQVPQPRLVCAEAAHSRAVVVARLESKRTVSGDSDADLNVYGLRTVRLLRGQVPATFTVNEWNDSGRAPFDWNTGDQYLLFLSYSPRQHAWVVDGCGNSRPLSQSVHILQDVEAMNHSDRQPLIAGMVSTDSWDTGVPNILVTVSGQGRIFHARTAADGGFQLRVPPGSYAVTAGDNHSNFPANPFSYENPGHLILEEGTCAQLEFSK